MIGEGLHNRLSDFQPFLGGCGWPEEVVSYILDQRRNWPNLYLLQFELPNNYTRPAGPYPVIVRPMSRCEYEFLEAVKEVLPIDEQVLLECVIWPIGEHRDEYPAGVIDSACQAVREMSGWSDRESLQTIQDIKRGLTGANKSGKSTLAAEIEMMLTTVFKGLTWREIQNLDAHKSMELTSMCERILETSFDLRTPEDKRAEYDRRKRIYEERYGNDHREQDT